MSTKTIGEVSKLSGVSISALRYYDNHGLFAGKLVNGGPKNQRVFHDEDIARLQMILFYRELGLGISEIRNLFQKDPLEPTAILNDQIAQLKAKAKRFEILASLAEIARDYGISILDFHLDEDRIREIVKAYQQAKETDIDRIRNLSDSERVTIVTAMLNMLETLKDLRHSSDRTAKDLAFQQIRDFSSLLKSVLDIDRISYRSMAKGIAGGGMITRLLDQSGGEGFSACLSELLTDYADQEDPPAEGEEEGSADLIEELLGMWM